MDILNRMTVTFLLIISFSFCYLNAQNPKAKFSISHCNDINGQVAPFEQGIEDFSVPPYEECSQKPEHNCSGGFVNVVHWLYANEIIGVNEIVPENNLILSSGNFIGGETGWIWITENSENGWTKFGNLIKDHIKPTFMSLGLKEFDNGLSLTQSYLTTLGGNGTVGLGNTCSRSYDANDKSTEAVMCKNLETKFKTVELTKPDGVNKYNIGIIGFITPDVQRVSLPGELEFMEVAATIKDKIKGSDIKTFIAIGDGSLDLAKQIIDQVDKVKLVIYGQAFSPSKIEKYPLPYNSGFIATAGRYGSSVGKMVLEIDTETGSITSVSGTQQITDHPGKLNDEALDADRASNAWIQGGQRRKNSSLGCTSFDLVGGKETCWRGECNLGNIMADAMVNCVLQTFSDKPFPYPLHSIWHGGAFSEDTLNGPGKIFQFYLNKLYPYHNGIHLVKVTGSNLKLVFQRSATGIDRDWGQLLQVSNGLEVQYDTTADVPKVIKIRIVQDDYGVPRLGDIEDDKVYYFVISTFIREGRGLYNFESEIWEDLTNMTDNLFDNVCLEDYIKSLNYISVGGEERIWINGESGGGPDGHSPCHNAGKTAVTVTLTIVYFAIFLGVVYVGYFYVIPRLRRPATPLEVMYPPNQL